MRHDCSDWIRLGKLTAEVKSFRLPSTQQSVQVLLTKEEITPQKKRHNFWLKVLYIYKVCMKVAKDLILLAKIVLAPNPWHCLIWRDTITQKAYVLDWQCLNIEYLGVKWKSNESVVCGATLQICSFVCVISDSPHTEEDTQQCHFWYPSCTMWYCV